MKAITITEPERVDLIEISEPVLGEDEVLIDVHYIGLCGSDLNIYRGTMPLVSYPRIPGHEISGVIRQKGAKVPETIKKGDRVMVSPYTHCGICPACRIGRPNTCEYNQTFGVQRDGALTKRIAVHYSKIFKSDHLSLTELALVEPLSVGYHAANRGRVSEVDIVLLIGCGTIGMGVLSACARKGATVIALDIDDEKLEQAIKFGAQYTINSKTEPVEEKIAELTNNEGVNVAIEAAGIPDTFRLAVDAVCFAGRVVYVGYAKDKVTFDTKQFVRKELNIMGSRNALHVFPAVIKMLEKQQHPFIDLVSKVYPFDQTAQALEDWRAHPGKIIKILIEINN